jgi:hypothetical protein
MSISESDVRAPRPRYTIAQEKFTNRKRILSRAKRRASALSHPISPPHLARWTPLRLLQAILDRGDVIALSNDDGRPGVHVLLSMPQYFFEKMVAVAASDEDAEDTDGTEYGQDEEDNHDDEASIGNAQLTDQTRWAEGGVSDLEADTADAEPSIGSKEPAVVGGPNNVTVLCCDQTEWAQGNRLDCEGGHEDDEPDADDEPEELSPCVGAAVRMPKLRGIKSEPPAGLTIWEPVSVGLDGATTMRSETGETTIWRALPGGKS